jgi:ABC-type polar amino acid transport system ATPase subunit
MSTPILGIRSLRITRGPRVIVDEAALVVRAGELVALMGPSGSGKTTILRAVAGLESCAAGEIDVAGRVGMVFQFHHLFANLTALHNVWLAPVHVHHVARPRAEARARQLLDMLGVGSVADSLPHELSGGEAQRVAIARALAVDPPLLLMDEPTASLDVSRRGELAATLRNLAGEGRAIVVATHDEDFASACAHRVVMLVNGRLS